MKIIFLFCLIFIVVCEDYRKPNKEMRKCLKETIGKENLKSLLLSLRKYHATNSKATLLDLINDRKPEYKDIIEKCLVKNQRRRLEKIGSDIVNPEEYFYVRAILKDKKVRRKIYKHLKKEGKETAIEICLKFINNNNSCKYIVNLFSQKLGQKKNNN